ncbi:hypothetical protein NW765_015820, partial [Fusarium oxysporum]
MHNLAFSFSKKRQWNQSRAEPTSTSGIRTGGIFSTPRQVEWARACVHAGTNADETILGDMRSFLPLVGGEYGAKDPKDHVYALLGVTTLDIEPDYTSKTPVASVYIAVC